MCRNIRPLHNFEPPAAAEEVYAAALQYVRKVSGTTRPSQANAATFERAVDEVAAAVEEKGIESPEVATQMSRLLTIARIDYLVLLLILADMVFKPGVG